MKILTIVGARPQFIKAAVVSRELKKRGAEELILHTGQHFDHNMSDVFFDEMEIPKPHVNLGVNASTHGAMTGRMMEGIEKTILETKPDWVLVYGDTNSTLAGALAARKLHVKVAHVESGLRSFNMLMPEEVNRILTDRISNILFCPTMTAIENLRKEGYDHIDAQVHLTGDVMYDAAKFYAERASSKSTILKTLGLSPDEYYLATCHRAENTDNPDVFERIVSAMGSIAEGKKVVFPVHPRTRKKLEGRAIPEGLLLIDPVGYFDMIELIRNSALIITDSGGLQKEAYFFGKFCVTIREESEWTELVENGYNKLAGSDTAKIKEAVNYFSSRKFENKENLYGDGNAASIIAELLLNG